MAPPVREQRLDRGGGEIDWRRVAVRARLTQYRYESPKENQPRADQLGWRPLLSKDETQKDEVEH